MAKRSSRSESAATKSPVGKASGQAGRPAVSAAKAVGSEWIRPGASGIHGRGVYARRDIPAGTRVVEYIGERITKAESRRREAARLEEQRRGGDGCVTIFTLNQRYDLDGRTPHNVARLINHSCAPNCWAEQTRGRIWIVAQRDIAAGEELTFDYGYPVSDWRLHPCRCGAPECPGYIVAAPQRRHLWRRIKKAGVASRGVRSRMMI